jgi:hypothetical protein
LPSILTSSQYRGKTLIGTTVIKSQHLDTHFPKDNNWTAKFPVTLLESTEIWRTVDLDRSRDGNGISFPL